MSAPAAPQLGDGMYSKLIDDDGPYEFSRTPELRQRVSPSSVPVTPVQRGPGLYRGITFGLAALCVVLVICLIAVSAHYKNKQQSQSSAGEVSPESQKQTQDNEVHQLLDTIKNLKEENQLLKDKLSATKAPAVVQPTSASAPIVCPDDWLLFNSSCYLVSRHTRSWAESQSYCQSQGAHLAIIHTAEEQTFIWNQLPRGHWNAYWFGITDSHTEDQWKWVDGTPLVGGFWAEGEPNNHIDEDCGYIVKTRVLKRVPISSWIDAPCSMYLPFICEKEMGPGASTVNPH